MLLQDSESSLDKAARPFFFLFSVSHTSVPGISFQQGVLVKLGRRRGAAALTLISLHAQPPIVLYYALSSLNPDFDQSTLSQVTLDLDPEIFL